MTCYQCEHYRAGQSQFETAYCEEEKIGFPFIGEKCQDFDYEPGTLDEE